MLWLVLGIGIGFTWHWLLGWARARGYRIGLGVWFLIILAVVAGLSGVQNYVALMQEYEEQAARMVVPVYGIQTLIPAALATLFVWRGVRKPRPR